MFYNRRIECMLVWRGIDAHGQCVRGKNRAPNKKSLQQILANQQITLLNCHWAVSWQPRAFVLTAKKRIHWSEQLAQLISAGLPLSVALQTMIKVAVNPDFSAWLTQIKNDIDQGKSLHATLAQFPRSFNAVYCAMIRAGEQIGKLGDILISLVQHLQNSDGYKQKIQKALYYPTIVLAVAILTTLGLFYFVIPQFQQTFNSFGAQLPWLTQEIINLSDFFRQHFFSLLFVIILLFFSCRYLINKYRVLKQAIDVALLKLPFLGRWVVMTHLTIWLKILNMTFAAGIPLLSALTIANQVLTNILLKHQLTSVVTAIQQGKSLHAAMHECNLLPPSSLALILVGESTGQLSVILEKLALYHQQQLNQLLDFITVLLEPIIMLILALLATILIIGLYLPVFRMGSLL